MDVAVDLHAHSMFAGGAGGLTTDPSKRGEMLQRAKKRFSLADTTSALKGLQVLGSGDIQFDPWLGFVREVLEEEEEGLFKYSEGSGLRYVLQTELILTTQVAGSDKRKVTHTVFLFPTIKVVEEFQALLDKYEVKRDRIARPFLTLDTPEDVSGVLYEVQSLDKWVEVIPAHVLTPEGVFGGNEGVNSLDEFYGDFTSEIHAVETGLSADPFILAAIPELDNKTLLSNSDAHSVALHRTGREFTVLSPNHFTYKSLVEALRKRQVAFTLEFPPTEGRYFFTGHRAGRKKPGKGHGKDEYCYFSPDKLPEGNICPICDAPLTKGVLQRVLEIGHHQGSSRTLESLESHIKQSFIHGVPLIEVVAMGLQLKSPTSKTAAKHYKELVEPFGDEVSLWRTDLDTFLSEVPTSTPAAIREAVAEVKKDNFSFSPPGFDGSYGKLQLGCQVELLGHAVVHRGT